MSPNSRAQPRNTASGSALASGMLPTRKCGLGPGGRFMFSLSRKTLRWNRVVYREVRMNWNVMRLALLLVCVVISSLVSVETVSAETRAEAWLRYTSPQDGTPSLPSLVAVVGTSEIVRTAGSELVRALEGRPAK